MALNELHIRCAHCSGTHPSVQVARRCAEDHQYQMKSQWDPVTASGSAIASIGDVEGLIEQPVPAFGELLDAIAVARGNDRWDLVDSCANLALASVTGETPSAGVFYVARQIAIARLKGVAYEDLARELAAVASQFKEQPAFLTRQANSAIESIEEELLDLALLIIDDRAPSLIAAGARLRKLDRPDLAVIAATRSIDRNGTVGVALTVRSAAQLDAEEPDGALADIKAAEELLPSFYTANVRARLETGRRRFAAAEHWALLANERDRENGAAGALSMMSIRAIQGRYADASDWARKANGNPGAEWSVEWMRLQAANELGRGGNRQDAHAILLDLWANSSYAPARRRLLELRYPVAA